MPAETRKNEKYGDELDPVLRYIRDHAGETLTRSVLAGLAGYSVPHFHRIFTQEMGENIADFVRRVRLERAGRKLRMGAVDISEVALAAGYRSHAAFARAFKERYGLSPGAFRKLACAEATRLLHEKSGRTPPENTPRRTES